MVICLCRHSRAAVSRWRRCTRSSTHERVVRHRPRYLAPSRCETYSFARRTPVCCTYARSDWDSPRIETLGSKTRSRRPNPDWVALRIGAPYIGPMLPAPRAAAFAARRYLGFALQAGGSGVAVQKGNTYAKANAKYHGWNWSKRRLPVVTVSTLSIAPALAPRCKASSAATCCAFVSPMPPLLFSFTTAFGLHISPSSSATPSNVRLSRTGVAAFCRCTFAKSSSYGKIAMISLGIPSSGNDCARVDASSMFRRLYAGCPRVFASWRSSKTTARRTRAWCR